MSRCPSPFYPRLYYTTLNDTNIAVCKYNICITEYLRGLVHFSLWSECTKKINFTWTYWTYSIHYTRTYAISSYLWCADWTARLRIIYLVNSRLSAVKPETVHSDKTSWLLQKSRDKVWVSGTSFLVYNALSYIIMLFRPRYLPYVSIYCHTTF